MRKKYIFLITITFFFTRDSALEAGKKIYSSASYNELKKRSSSHKRSKSEEELILSINPRLSRKDIDTILIQEQIFFSLIRKNLESNHGETYEIKILTAIIQAAKQFLNHHEDSNSNKNNHERKNYLLYLQKDRFSTFPYYLQKPLWLLIKRGYHELCLNTEIRSIFDQPKYIVIDKKNYQAIAQELSHAENLCMDTKVIFFHELEYLFKQTDILSVLDWATFCNHKSMINFFITIGQYSLKDIFRSMVKMNKNNKFFLCMRDFIQNFTKENKNYESNLVILLEKIQKQDFTIDLIYWFLSTYAENYYTQAELIWSNGNQSLAEHSFKNAIERENFEGVNSLMIAFLQKDLVMMNFLLRFYKNILDKRNYFISLPKNIQELSKTLKSLFPYQPQINWYLEKKSRLQQIR